MNSRAKRSDEQPAAGGGKTAFFFLGPETADKEGYPHSAVLLAEGLSDLGWKISSNLRIWQEFPGGPFLFPGGSLEEAESADLIVFEEDYFFKNGSDRLPDLRWNASAPKVFIDRSDLIKGNQSHQAHPVWSYGASLSKLDLILRTHSSSYFRYPRNISPIVFGITHRIARATEGGPKERDSTALWNFRHNQHPHSARLWAEKHVKPVIASRMAMSTELNLEPERDTAYADLMRRQTAGRHFTSYYEQMKRASVCACFGGWFLAPVPQREAGFFCMKTRALIKRLPFSTPAVAQWDSWRLWEAFASGTAVLHFNFDNCGFLLGGPMPEAMKHYIPVSLYNPAKSLAPILENQRMLAKIGLAGQQWAAEHYGSTAITTRVLDTLGIN